MVPVDLLLLVGASGWPGPLVFCLEGHLSDKGEHHGTHHQNGQQLQSESALSTFIFLFVIIFFAIILCIFGKPASAGSERSQESIFFKHMVPVCNEREREIALDARSSPNSSFATWTTRIPRKKGEAPPWTVLKKPCWFDDVCCTYSYCKHDCGNHPMKKNISTGVLVPAGLLPQGCSEKETIRFRHEEGVIHLGVKAKKRYVIQYIQDWGCSWKKWSINTKKKDLLVVSTCFDP